MPDLVIIGGGPTGLSAANEARTQGLSVIVLEREAEAGGAPRHCGHTGFGLIDQHHLLTGPRYAARLRDKAQGIDLRCGHAVTALGPDGTAEVSSPDGPYTLRPRRILLATGIRETPRAPRLISGGRPFGVFTTGALQRFIYLHHRLPCRTPIVIGSELVAFSTILTLRHMGTKPQMLLDEATDVRSPFPIALAARLIFGVPTHTGIDLLRIEGQTRVEALTIRQEGQEHTLPCDAVIFSGDWLPEATLARLHPIGIDPATQGPAVNKTLRTKDPHLYAAGNVLYSVRSSGRCALEGRRAARLIAADLGANA